MLLGEAKADPSHSGQLFLAPLTKDALVLFSGNIITNNYSSISKCLFQTSINSNNVTNSGDHCNWCFQ